MKRTDSVSLATRAIPLYTPEQVSRMERIQRLRGTTSLRQIERAARALMRFLPAECRKKSGAVVFCGNGNCGADGYAFSLLLQKEGYDVTLVPVPTGKITTENEAFFRKASETIPVLRSLDFPKDDVFAVDAIFGSGFRGELPEEAAKYTRALNASGLFVYAVDLPSGVDAQSGKVSAHAVRANACTTLSARKPGTYVYPGAGYCKSAPRLGAAILPIGEPFAKTTAPVGLKDRNGRTNKGSFGTVGVIAGSRNMAGAAFFAANAAYLSGAGLVKIITEACNRTILQTLLPDATLYCYEEDTPPERIVSAAEGCTTLVLGPGLSQNGKQRALVQAILSCCSQPLIADADALNLSARTELLQNYPGKLVITPHPGEAARLLGTKIPPILEDPLSTVKKLSETYRCTAVLKDAHTLICKNEEIFVNLTGNSGMSVGGSGDLLAGMIGALLFEIEEESIAAQSAVCLHGLAGDLAAKKYGKRSLTASRIAEFLPEAFVLAQSGSDAGFNS